MSKESVCINCGGPLGRNKMYCSQRCRAEYLKSKRKCVVCGKMFYAPPSSDSKCCSKTCSKIHRSKLHASGNYNKSVPSMMKGKAEFWAEHTGEKHINAKHWIIQSPDGEIYDCQNLFFFIREHPDLFDGTERQAFDGFEKIKSSIEGKRKNPSYTWKGWRLLDYS